MIVKIQTRGDDGRYRPAYPREFAEAALHCIFIHGGFRGWEWFREQLSHFCLWQADRNASNPVVADAWIKRYQQIRGIE